MQKNKFKFYYFLKVFQNIFFGLHMFYAKIFIEKWYKISYIYKNSKYSIYKKSNYFGILNFVVKKTLVFNKQKFYSSYFLASNSKFGIIYFKIIKHFFNISMLTER